MGAALMQNFLLLSPGSQWCSHTCIVSLIMHLGCSLVMTTPSAVFRINCCQAFSLAPANSGLVSSLQASAIIVEHIANGFTWRACSCTYADVYDRPLGVFLLRGALQGPVHGGCHVTSTLLPPCGAICTPLCSRNALIAPVSSRRPHPDASDDR